LLLQAVKQGSSRPYKATGYLDDLLQRANSYNEFELHPDIEEEINKAKDLLV